MKNAEDERMKRRKELDAQRKALDREWQKLDRDWQRLHQTVNDLPLIVVCFGAVAVVMATAKLVILFWFYK